MEDARSKIKIRTESCFSTAKPGSYFLELSRIGLWPISEMSHKCSIDQVFNKLSEFQNYPVERPDRYSSSCNCKTCKINFKDKIVRVVTEQRKLLKGLCLTCVGAGRISAGTSNCQSVTCCYETISHEVHSSATEGIVKGLKRSFSSSVGGG